MVFTLGKNGCILAGDIKHTELEKVKYQNIYSAKNCYTCELKTDPNS